MSTKNALLAAWLVVGAMVLSAATQAQPEEDAKIAELIDASGFDGSFLAYQLHADRYRAGHSERINKALIPASTFKIFSALVALELGVVQDENSVIDWDGTIRNRTELNADLNLETAFRLSAVPHFQTLVRRIGHERMQHYIDAVGYGNRDISGGDDSFWLQGNLRISPQQQIDFLVRLYRNELPFRPEVMETVKRIMGSEQGPSYVLRNKTGLAILEGDHHIGWWVGWVEEKDEVTFFAIALEAIAPGEGFNPARIAIARDALNSLGAAIKR
jgi:beta-lactamase class D